MGQTLGVNRQLFLGRFFVPEGQMRVARRFIAGFGPMGLRPGGTPEYRRAINPKDIVLQSRYRVSLEKPTPCASGHRSLNLLAQFGHSNQVRRDATLLAGQPASLLQRHGAR